MTRLDQNRAASQLAIKAGVPVDRSVGMTIWGNHSDTKYPDYKNARIGGKPATEVIARRGLVQGDLHPDRGQARGGGDQGPRRSSAASAANATSTAFARSMPHDRTTGSAPPSSPTAATASPPACSTATR